MNSYKSALWTNTSALLENGMEKSTGRGDVEKIIAIVILGLGSFLSGILPALISERNRQRFPLVTSLLLCFGAGILLATAMIHILPEVREQLACNYAEIALCAGFFFIYFIDEFIHYFFGEAIQHSHQSVTNDNVGHVNNPTVTNYGALSSTPLVNNNNGSSSCNHNHTLQNTNQSNYQLSQEVCAQDSHEAQVVCNDHVVEDANARICHTNHTEPCAQSMTGTLGLFVALSLHSAIEGLAIGVQNSATKVLFLLAAVSCHKFVMSFCLGLELCSNPRTALRSHLLGILVFAAGAIFGIALGMIIVDIPAHFMSTTLPVIQALAGGTLLYVTVCEVIPREKARWHQNTHRKVAGLVQFLAVILGFVCMTILTMLLVEK